MGAVLDEDRILVLTSNLWRAALPWLETGNWDHTLRQINLQLLKAEQESDRDMVFASNIMAAYCYQKMGLTGQSALHIESALSMVDTLRNPRLIVEVRMLLSKLASQNHEYASAKQLLLLVSSDLKSVGSLRGERDIPLQRTILWRLAVLSRLTGDSNDESQVYLNAHNALTPSMHHQLGNNYLYSAIFGMLDNDPARRPDALVASAIDVFSKAELEISGQYINSEKAQIQPLLVAASVDFLQGKKSGGYQKLWFARGIFRRLHLTLQAEGLSETVALLKLLDALASAFIALFACTDEVILQHYRNTPDFAYVREAYYQYCELEAIVSQTTGNQGHPSFLANSSDIVVPLNLNENIQPVVDFTRLEAMRNDIKSRNLAIMNKEVETLTTKVSELKDWIEQMRRSKLSTDYARSVLLEHQTLLRRKKDSMRQWLSLVESASTIEDLERLDGTEVDAD